jgi:hypothetical protein
LTDLPTQNRRQNQLWWPEQKSIGDWFVNPKPTPKSTLVTEAEVDWRLIYQPKNRCLSTVDLLLWRRPFFRERSIRQSKTASFAQICYLSPFRKWSSLALANAPCSKKGFHQSSRSTVESTGLNIRTVWYEVLCMWIVGPFVPNRSYV